jgi:hypothetical protein
MQPTRPASPLSRAQPGPRRSDVYARGFTADRRGMTVDLTFENASVQSAVGINHFTAVALWKRLGELLRQVDEADERGADRPGPAFLAAAGSVQPARPSSPPSAQPRPARMRTPSTS